MKTRKFFKKGNEIVEVINGRFGEYARQNGYNYGVKRWLALGYEIVVLTNDEIYEIMLAYNAEQSERSKAIFAEKMQDRFNQVNVCLASEPLPIVCNDGGSWQVPYVANITGGMADAYKGCGKGTAYVDNGKVIAFHYGFDAPANAPACESMAVEISCYQLCF